MRRLIVAIFLLVSSYSAALSQQCSSGNPIACGSPGMNAPAMVAPVINDGGPSGGHKGSVTVNFPSQATLLAFQPINVGTSMLTANISGRTTAGDGGYGTYVWNSASTATVADPFVLQSTGVTTGRWILQVPPSGLNVRVGGAKCDGVTDDSSAINTLYSNANTASIYNSVGGRFTAYVPMGAQCLLGSATNVTILQRQELRGVGLSMDETNNGVSLSVGGLIIAPTKTLLLKGALRNMMVTVQGLVQLPTTIAQVFSALQAWQAANSVGITVNHDDALIDNVMVVGFATGVSSPSFQRVHINNLWAGDNINGLDLSNSADTPMLSNINLISHWSNNVGTTIRALYAVDSIGAGGSGYTDGAPFNLTMTATGNTCSTLPVISVSSTGGVVTAVNSIVDPGSCTAMTGSNPMPFTGGTGTGATFNITIPSHGYRPGIGINIHDAADAVLMRGLSIHGFQIGLQLSNVWGVKVSQANIEAGWHANTTLGNLSSVGLNLINAVAGVTLTDIYTQGGLGIGANFNFSGAQQGFNSTVFVSNMVITSPSQFDHNAEGMFFGPNSKGQIVNIGNGAPGFTGGASYVFSSTDTWSITNMQGKTTPLYIMDAASAPNVNILTLPNIVSLNSGSTLTANCNDTIYANDTTAPTITMPAVCPLGQNVMVFDVGNQAGAHNITLSMPGGSTIKRGTGTAGSSLVMSTNGDSVNVYYNGVSAVAR